MYKRQDGYGDLNGVTQKLDYLNQLGVKALWLSPIHPCMSYHGYDAVSYTHLQVPLLAGHWLSTLPVRFILTKTLTSLQAATGRI